MKAPQQEIGQYSQDVWLFFCLHSNSLAAFSYSTQNLLPHIPRLSSLDLKKMLLLQYPFSFAVQPGNSCRLKEFSRDLGVESWKCHSASFKLLFYPLSSSAPQAL